MVVFDTKVFGLKCKALVRRKKKGALIVLKDGTVDFRSGLARAFEEIQHIVNHPTETDQCTESIRQTNIFSMKGV